VSNLIYSEQFSLSVKNI